MDNKEHMSTKRIFKNLSVVYRELFRYARQSIWQLPLYALVCIILPLLLSAIPAVAIEMLTQDDLGRCVWHQRAAGGQYAFDCHTHFSGKPF